MYRNKHPERWILQPLVALLLVAGAAGVRAADPPPERIQSAGDLGLRGADLPVSSESKLVFLVNPALNRPSDLEAMLRPAGSPSHLPGFSYAPFAPEELRALAAPARPGATAAYHVVSDVAEQLFRHLFTQVPSTERTLHRIVHEVNREDFLLAAFDVAPRLLTRRGEKDRHLETLVTVRLFMLHIEGDRDRGLRWVTRSELCFEDSAVGRAPFPSGREPGAALAASVVDALRGKIALSFAYSPSLRRASGKIDEPRRELIERSISEVVGAPAANPAVGLPAGPALPESSSGVSP